MVSRGNEDPGTALRLFEEMLEVAEGEREAWLDHHCAGDEAVRQEVLRLLRRDAEDAELVDFAPLEPGGIVTTKALPVGTATVRWRAADGSVTSNEITVCLGETVEVEPE